jgi:hypothetical protein
MFTKKELAWIVVAILIAAFISLLPLTGNENPFDFSISLAIFAIIILSSIVVKKLVANIVSITIEHKGWEWQRYSWYERSKFKKPIPAGLIFPFLIAILSQGVVGGILRPFTILQFDSKNIPERRYLRAHQGQSRKFRRTEMNESDPAMVATAGFYALLLLAIIGIIFKIPELTKYSIYYGAWNLIPFSQLDGSRLFFGSAINWFLLVVLYVIAMFLMAIF